MLSASGEELCSFFRGTGLDSECRTLEQILQWDDLLLEVCHDYIQWLLPSDEPSRFNSDAPVFNEDAQEVFRVDEQIRHNLRRAVQRFFKFLGFELLRDGASEGEGVLRLVRAENFERRIRTCWQGPRNHNWRRLSRALHCLRLAGLWEERRALIVALEELLAEYPGMIEQCTLDHWYAEAGIKATISSQEDAGRAAVGPSDCCSVRALSPGSTTASSAPSSPSRTNAGSFCNTKCSE